MQIPDGKRTKLEALEAIPARSSSHDLGEKRRVSIAVPESHIYGRQGSSSGPPSPAFAVAGTQPVTAHNASPGVYTFSSVNSPQTGARYSPMSASPVSSLVHREMRESTGMQQPTEVRERERQADYRPPSRNPSAPQTPVSHLYGTPPTQNYNVAAFSSGISLPSRRAPVEHFEPPPLLHEETSVSTDSSAFTGTPYQAPATLPTPMDAVKAQRTLPQPVPSLVPTPSPLHQRQAMDMRQTSGSSGWPALLRAGEIFRDADSQNSQAQGGDKDNPPTGGG